MLGDVELDGFRETESDRTRASWKGKVAIFSTSAASFLYAPSTPMASDDEEDQKRKPCTLRMRRHPWLRAAAVIVEFVV
jgi:hypothetical protein